MTGERGRIADIEREIANARVQIEQLSRTEEMMRQKESEIAILIDRAKEVGASIEEVRATLHQAGLVRERAAHVAQNARMQKELASLEESARSLDARMRGKHPTPVEMEEKRRLLEGIREARARVNEIASLSAQTEKYEILKPDFQGTLPSKDDFSSMLAANLELQNIIHREVGLQTPTESAAARYFTKFAPPAEEEIKALSDALTAEEAAKATKAEQKGSGKRTLSRAPSFRGGNARVSRQT
jgi:hypothetical protein